MGIYTQMKRDWRTYCIMSCIIYIEEMSKPTEHIQIKKYKDRVYKCISFHSIRLKMRDPEFVSNFFETTKLWENKKNEKFIGPSFSKPRVENFDNQNKLYLSPRWLNLVLKECGKIPNKYSFETAIKRVNCIKQYKKEHINRDQETFKIMLNNKKLAAGAFVVSIDLEFRGVSGGRLSLCMSKKYKDFLEFMLKVAKKWGWTNNKKLSKVNIENSKKVGINATEQFEFRLSSKGLQEIHKIAGPLTNSHKEKCVRFNTKRSKNYVNRGGKHKLNNSKEKIINFLKNNKNSTTTELQFVTNTGTDVVLDHLHDLHKLNKVTKERKGKRYVWNVK